MGYQVTARKWRPQTFDDIVEQQHVTRTLKNAVRLGRVAHAYLFAGTRGVGKTTMARVLAKALNCEYGPSENPCNTCQSCLEITQGTSLDIVEIDGASNRGIDEIRDLRERLRYLPARGRYKVYIIDEVHMLTKEAFNALLKTLEEPPSHVVFIFATTELDKIPYTIVSRCQRFEFKRVSLAGMADQLEHTTTRDGITVSRATLLRVAKAAEGSMRDAQSLLDQVVAFCGMEVRDEEANQVLGQIGSEVQAQCLQALFQQDAATALRTIAALQDTGHEVIGITRALLEGLRHLIVLKTTTHPEELIPLSETELDVLRAIADMVSVEEIYGHFQVLTSAEQMLRQASNPLMVLEMTLVRMACIGRVQPLQSILDHLQRFDAGLSVSPTIPSMPLPLPPKLEKSGSAEHSVPPPREGGLNHHGGEPEKTFKAPPMGQSAAVPAVDTTQEQVSNDLPPVTVAVDFWQAIQQYVVDRRPALAAFLQPGRVVKQDEREFVLGFAKGDNFRREKLLETENLVLLREAAQAVLKHPVQVLVETLGDGPKNGHSIASSAGVEKRQNPGVEELQRKKRHTIQAVLDIFDGRLLT